MRHFKAVMATVAVLAAGMAAMAGTATASSSTFFPLGPKLTLHVVSTPSGQLRTHFIRANPCYPTDPVYPSDPIRNRNCVVDTVSD
jgi:hypothetical protein